MRARIIIGKVDLNAVVMEPVELFSRCCRSVYIQRALGCVVKHLKKGIQSIRGRYHIGGSIPILASGSLPWSTPVFSNPSVPTYSHRLVWLYIYDPHSLHSLCPHKGNC